MKKVILFFVFALGILCSCEKVVLTGSFDGSRQYNPLIFSGCSSCYREV